MIFKLWEKYKKEAWDNYNGRWRREPTWREAILESIFRPQIVLPPGKGPMTHLHPDIDKLHLPHGIYISDWRKYKVEDHPALVNFQKKCHAAGLHDPWLRNYAYRYYPNNLTRRSRLRVITREMRFGFLAALVITGSWKIYRHFYPARWEHSAEYRERYGDAEVDSH